MRKVLVVDDHYHTHRIVRGALTGLDVEVLVADDGLSGAALARAEQPDLILLDRTMPEKNGLEVLDELKGEEPTRSIPVVMLTAQDAKHEVEEALQHGAEHFMSKPFEPQALRQLVIRLLTHTDQA